MPSKQDSQSAASRQRPPTTVDNYFLEGDFDDPFASPSPDAGKNKRKAPEGLGIDEEVQVQKRVRVPRVKLDEARLLSEKGIPTLRRKAKDLKFKGKGHEFSDAARLMSFYQLWLDDLFPKAKFLDALAMVEKAGHKKTMHLKRMEWINEGKPRAGGNDDDDDDDVTGEDEPAREPERNESTRIAPIFEKNPSQRQKTPTGDDPLAANDDIYNATPRQSREVINAEAAQNSGEPYEDDLDALMAEAEALSASNPVQGSHASAQTHSNGPPDDDDLDALLAEAEVETSRSQAVAKPALVSGSIFGGDSRRVQSNTDTRDEMDDLDALIAEAESG